ncbi:PREDICTED: decaprenyl-diphosphate synthase subunit 1 [Merops nubicus]|uniref:decaprenyl-diphosphate synthase subunit 1 n=1 Tax=Merops nubicus TaxID=57421 RepID=UPI0004F06BED|nr:PREDICTED: decaprenyl-diphosphate synthase subunit 1 [Merops nubicus]
MEHGIEWVCHIPCNTTAAGKTEVQWTVKMDSESSGRGVFKHWDTNLAKDTWLVNTRGSTNQAGPAQSKLLCAVERDNVPIMHMKNVLGKMVWVNPASGKGKLIHGIAFALGPGCTWEVQASQRSVAIIAEMIHTASLVHDDVIDDANSRRGKMTVNQIWGERKAVLAGDFILSAASVALARIGNTTIISVLTQVIEDLVRGEFLQLGSKENENERFAHYLEKTFKKTASLIANSCKAVSILGCPDPKVHEIAYQYGKNVGIAFQLIDDVLDFTSCADHLGKPTAADLKLGLATGPVLFACRQFPEMNAMIMRRFSKPGDVERARQYVLESDGVQQTTYLAQRYCHAATREIRKLRPSPERQALIQLTEMVLLRDK